MSLYDWLTETGQRVRRDGVRVGGRRSLRKFYYGSLRRVDRFLDYARINPGKNVFSAEWDALIVLDGCRYDLFTDVVGNSGIVESLDSRLSVAGGSLSWMHRTFEADHDLSNVGYVTANPFTEQAVNGGRFGAFDEVWRHSWDDNLGTVRAAAVTDAAIETFRGEDVTQAIVHYMQPHHPFVPNPIAAGINPDDPVDHDTTVWEKLRDGEIDRVEAMDGYRANLRYVMDEVKRLVRNLDAPRTVITADHGNALGEWRVYGHGDYPIPQLRRVPWALATATDERTAEPEVNRRAVDTDISQQLHDLGYQ